MPPEDELEERLRERSELFARPLPAGWDDEWSKILAQRPETQDGRTGASLIFRLRHVRLSFSCKVIRSVSPILPVCRIPQYPATSSFLGLVAVGGEIVPCCSLARLLGLPGVTSGAGARTLVLQQRPGELWAFFTDEVLAVTTGVERSRHDGDPHAEIGRGWSDTVFEEPDKQATLLLKPAPIFEAMCKAIE